MFVLSQANRLLPLLLYLAYRHESGIELASYDVILLYIYILFGTTEECNKILENAKTDPE